MSQNNKNSALEVAVSFLVGAATGFLLGILFAPASGKETRKKIKDEVEKTTEKAKEGLDKIAREAEKGFKSVKEKTHESVEAIREFVDRKKEDLTKRHAGAPSDES